LLKHGLDCFDALHGLGVRLIELRILLTALCWLGQDEHAARGPLGESRRTQLLHNSRSVSADSRHGDKCLSDFERDLQLCSCTLHCMPCRRLDYIDATMTSNGAMRGALHAACITCQSTSALHSGITFQT